MHATIEVEPGGNGECARFDLICSTYIGLPEFPKIEKINNLVRFLVQLLEVELTLGLDQFHLRLSAYHHFFDKSLIKTDVQC